MSYNTCSLCLTLVTVAKYAQVYPEDSISTVVETIPLESRMEVVVEETVVQREDMKLPKQIILEQTLSQSVRERDDDWFLLQDVVPRETAYVPPGTHSLQISFLFTYIITPKKSGCQTILLKEDFR